MIWYIYINHPVNTWLIAISTGYPSRPPKLEVTQGPIRPWELLEAKGHEL